MSLSLRFAGSRPRRSLPSICVHPRPTVAVFVIAFVGALSLPAQTLQQAEQLRKEKDYYKANEVFKALVAREPKNAEYRIRWGRLMLEKQQPDDAAALFNEALEIKKDAAEAYVGLAQIAADGFEARATDQAKTALKYEPKMVEAQELLARLALEDGDNPAAIEEAHKALKLDANSVQAKAIIATMDWLADKKESPWDPKHARGYETAGHFFVLNRRYEEGIAFYRKALELDPELYSARAQLGVNLMRMGRDEEAFQELLACFNNGFQSKPTTNSLQLLETLKKFQTFKSGGIILRLDPKEAEILRPYFESEIARSIATYEKKYKYKLQKPVQVEVYPNHPDFEVRTLGMPGLGALGVTFGHSIAMDSPSSRTPGSFHWASTLWHEMSHVFTLAMTASHVPRWFTEGIAVHEETAVSPEWGDRLSPDVIAAIKDKKLLPITELDRGFIHPKSPAQVGVSYFQGGRIVDFIVEKRGWDTILAMLQEFGKGADTAAVVRGQLKLEPAEFDKQFLAYVETGAARQVQNFEEWRKGIKQVAEFAKAKDHDGVIKQGTAIRDLYPDYVETGSVYEFLANALIAKGDKAAASEELMRYAKMGGRDPGLLTQLSKQLAEAGRKKEAADVLERLNFIYPMDNEQHQALGALALELKDYPKAIREFSALVAHNPIDPADAHYQLARAYHLSAKPDLAKDAVLSALEAAPGYRPAQKLLLELSAAETSGTPGQPDKK